MLTIINDKNEIKKAQKLFEQTIQKTLKKSNIASIGYQGGNQQEIFYWSPELCLWAIFSTSSSNRFWNAFGILDKPELPKLNSIDVEINFPFSGLARSIAGVIAKDERGGLIIAHRGKIGGGRKGVGQKLFFDNYNGETEILQDGQNECKVALVGALSSSHFIGQIHNFVQEVKRIKLIPTMGKSDASTNAVKEIFSPEFCGDSTVKRNATEITRKCDHGFLVKNLEAFIKKQGLKTANDVKRDLYILDKNKTIVVLFEIKSDLSLDSIYSGIGQLLLNSINLSKKPKLVLVLPNTTSSSLKISLKKIGINYLSYRWEKDTPKFLNCSEIL